MRSTLPTLEKCKELAVLQAEAKEWDISTKWLKKKFKHEVNEFLRSIDKSNPRNVVKEFADVVVVGTQLTHKKAKKWNLDFAYNGKITDNYMKKKKTWDSKKKKVIRK